MSDLLEWPDRLPGRTWVPGENDCSTQRDPPEGVVIHSGSIGAGLTKASLRMDISYHFTWNVKLQLFVQLVSMQRRAWHGGSRGNKWLGVAMSGPATQDPRDAHELEDLRLLLVQIKEIFNGHLKYWCRHSDYEKKKSDPGPGLDNKWVKEETGLIWKKPG